MSDRKNKRKFRDPLVIGELVLFSLERLKKKIRLISARIKFLLLGML